MSRPIDARENSAVSCFMDYGGRAADPGGVAALALPTGAILTAGAWYLALRRRRSSS
jgi:hypothetical protein